MKLRNILKIAEAVERKIIYLEHGKEMYYYTQAENIRKALAHFYAYHDEPNVIGIIKT